MRVNFIYVVHYNADSICTIWQYDYGIVSVLYLPNTDPYRLDLKCQDVLLKQLKVYEDQNVFLKALCHRWILRTSCTEPQQYSEYG
jgi:hypothetical protein